MDKITFKDFYNGLFNESKLVGRIVIEPEELEIEKYEESIIVGNLKFKEKLLEIIFNEKDNFYYLTFGKTTIVGMFRIGNENSKTVFGSIWNRKGYEGLIEQILIDYVLPKYKLVISDDILTKDGLNFTKRLFENSKLKISIYDIEKDQEIEVNSFEESLEYHSCSSKLEKFRLMVLLK